MKSQSLVSLLIALVIVVAVMGRRIRPQPVNPTRYLVTALIFVAIAVFAIGSAGTELLSDPLAIALAPVLLAAGVGLGVLLVRTMRFYIDPASGRLWMRGGLVYVAVFVATLVVRFGAEYLSGGFSGGGFSGRVTSHSPLAIVAVDLLFLSIGMWVTRAVLLWLRWRAHQAGRLALPDEAPPLAPGG
jgi:hypothetical protein